MSGGVSYCNKDGLAINEGYLDGFPFCLVIRFNVGFFYVSAFGKKAAFFYKKESRKRYKVAE